jgi:hypothetical protein
VRKDKAEAMKPYARQAKDTDLLNWAAEIKLRAERKAGEILIDMEKNKGGRKITSDSVSPVKKPALKDLGITNKQSSHFQQVAKTPEKKFEKL